MRANDVALEKRADDVAVSANDVALKKALVVPVPLSGFVFCVRQAACAVFCHLCLSGLRAHVVLR